MKFFHVSPTDFQENFIIQPGRFGVNWILPPMTEHTTSDLRRTYLTEIACEHARRLIAPTKPSRLSYVFAFETADNAVKFNAQFRNGVGRIYLVKPVDETPNLHRGEMKLLNPVGGENQLDFLCRVGSEYWTTEPNDVPELLIGGPVSIISQL